MRRPLPVWPAATDIDYFAAVEESDEKEVRKI